MKLVMGVTERDKKLLAVLAVFLMIFGVGAGIIYPLLMKSDLIRERIMSELDIKAERSFKVEGLPVLTNREKNQTDQLQALQSDYYEVMDSADIDKMMTGTALDFGLFIQDLNIQMWPDTEYPVVAYYQGVINESSQTDAEDTVVTETVPLEGIHVATIGMTLSGSRENLQRMIDYTFEQAPKQRLVSFSWAKNMDAGRFEYTCHISMDLYMCEDVEEFVERKLEEERKAQEAEAAQNGEEVVTSVSESEKAVSELEK